jgi:hypothetical protein
VIRAETDLQGALMEALKLLFTSDIGLLSLFTIVFIIGMGIWFRRFFTKQIEAEEARNPR